MSKSLTLRPASRLVVLDWDDTCCPSSWIAAVSDTEYDEPANLELLRCIEEGILTLFRAIVAVGCSVVIITNADEEWVRFSARRFLPRVVPLLSRVRVVSARHYEGLYPGRSVCWKAAAFTHVAKAFFCGTQQQPASDGEDMMDEEELHYAPNADEPREIISIGDSNDERLAVRAASGPLKATPKAIKLVDAPTLQSVAAQLHTVTTCLPFLVLSDHAVDVDVAAILNYINLGQRFATQSSSSSSSSSGHTNNDMMMVPPMSNNPEASLNDQLWHEAAWGILTAIRFQSLSAAASSSSSSSSSPAIIEGDHVNRLPPATLEQHHHMHQQQMHEQQQHMQQQQASPPPPPSPTNVVAAVLAAA